LEDPYANNGKDKKGEEKGGKDGGKKEREKKGRKKLEGLYVGEGFVLSTF
jgi:hypothetical protein